MLSDERLAAIQQRAEKATPGPWKIGRHSTAVSAMDGFAVADTAGVHLHDDYDADAGHWASTPGAHRDIPEEEEEANACLIAAVPDLLADAAQARTLLREALGAMKDVRHNLEEKWGWGDLAKLPHDNPQMRFYAENSDKLEHSIRKLEAAVGQP